MKSRLVEQHCAFTPLPPSLARSLALSVIFMACMRGETPGLFCLVMLETHRLQYSV